jgi:SWI/SNF-related matrix-associated actin-dependent regulator 1 of chromatin subfamily A
MLGDEQGLGKTVQAIKAFEECEGITLIVCPAFLKGTWEKEINQWSTGRVVYQVKPAKKLIEDERGIYIISYDTLHRFELLPRCVVFDECHYLKNMDAKRTKRAHELIWRVRPELCFLLSGTPIKNCVVEYFSPLKILSYCPTPTNGEKLPEKSQYAFSIRYSNASVRTIYTPGGRSVDVTEFSGVRNLPRLRQILNGKYLRRTAKQVLDLPEIIDREIYLDDIPKSLQTKLRESFSAFAGGKVDKETHFATVKKDFALRKCKATINLAVNILDQGEKVVIFSDHREPVKEIASNLSAAGYRVRTIMGGMDIELRYKAVQLFQAGGLDAIVCTIGAASTGLTLTAAKNMIFNDICWGYTDLIQARARIHRIGQEEKCVVSYILGGDVDKMIKRRVMIKEKNLKEAL